MTSTRVCAVCGAMLDELDTNITCERCSSSTQQTEKLTSDRPGSEEKTQVPSLTDSYPVSDRKLPPSALLNADTNPEGYGAYQDLKEVGKWEFGTIYDAYQASLDRSVRLRVLESDSVHDESIRNEFLRRVKLLSTVNHANVLTTLEAGTRGKDLFVAEEKLDSKTIEGYLPRSISQRFVEGFFPGNDFYRTMRDAALGLQAIHEAGLAHGFVSRETILVDEHNQVRLTPWKPDWIEGPGRISIETKQPAAASVESDLCQLGLTFFVLATGAVPDKLKLPIAEELRALNPGLQTDFCQIVERILRPQKNNQYENAKSIADDLNHLLKRRVVRARWRPRIFSQVLGHIAAYMSLSLGVGSVLLALPLEEQSRYEVLLFLPFLLHYLYTIAMESIVGWTVFRRLFGLQLYDISGQLARWPRRLGRALLKFGIFAFGVLLPACLLPLLTMFGSASFAFGCAMTLLIVLLPIGILYFPSIWIKNRWTYYDLLAGTTWAEEINDRQTGFGKIDAIVEQGASSKSRVTTGSVDQYDIYETLGTGGMGNVFHACDRVLQRDVAIKVLASHLVADSNLLHRFQREAQLAASISHPNVGKVYGNGIYDGAPYIAIEFVKGQDLSDHVAKNGALSVTKAWHFMMQAVNGLRAADQLGVVHRDIKPANLMISTDDELKVMDFGISFQTSRDIQLTKPGELLGTPIYMSPEQAKGDEVDRRSDIYSLGMTLYFLLSGRPPFSGSNSVQILAQQMTDHPEPLSGDIDDWTVDREQVLNKMIAKDPMARYQDYDTLLMDLQRTYPGIDRLAKPPKRIAAALCTLFCAFMILLIANLFNALFVPSMHEPAMEQRSNLIFGVTKLLSFVAIFCIYVVSIYFAGRTTGEKLLRLRICSADGGKVKFRQALTRFVAQYPYFVVLFCATIFWFTPYEFKPGVGLLVSYSALVVNSVMLAISTAMLWVHPRRQTLHDLVAGTIVENDDR